MFDVEIKNLKIFAHIGISYEERKKKQLLKVTLNFSYNVPKGKNLETMSNLKDYSSITKSLKKFINESNYSTLEKLIISSSNLFFEEYSNPKVKDSPPSTASLSILSKEWICSKFNLFFKFILFFVEFGLYLKESLGVKYLL